MVGPKKQDYLSKNQYTQRKQLRKIPLMNDGSSKSAKIVLTKSIFDVKNQQNFFIVRLSILFSEIRPSF